MSEAGKIQLRLIANAFLSGEQITALVHVTIGYKFCCYYWLMDKNDASEEAGKRKFQIAIGEKIAYVEIISLPNCICTVEFAGQQPVFITRIRDRANTPTWVSIPQGNDEIALIIGKYIDEDMHKKGSPK